MTIKVSVDKEGLEPAEGLSEPSYCSKRLRSLKSEERLINLHNAKVAASSEPWHLLLLTESSL
jgi:hypothetical protein